MHPFHLLGVVGVFDESLFNVMHGFLVTFSLIKETTKNEFSNKGYKFDQDEETYNIVVAHGHFKRLIFQYGSLDISRSLHFFIVAWHVVGLLLLILFLVRFFSYNRSLFKMLWKDVIGNVGCLVLSMGSSNLPLMF